MIEVVLLWWIVVPIGLAGIVGEPFHLLDGPGVAQEIGFTRGDGGFQTEVGFGDLALGIAAVGCISFRDRYWLAILVMAAISLTDILFPLAGLVLYAARERLRGRDHHGHSLVAQAGAGCSPIR